MTTPPAFLIARLYAMSPAEGGADAPFYTGYRPLFRYVDGPIGRYHVVEVELCQERVDPGQSAECRILLHHPEFHRGCAVAGKVFELSDGPKVRATGVILRTEGLDDPGEHRIEKSREGHGAALDS
jgi:hypothetical protein